MYGLNLFWSIGKDKVYKRDFQYIAPGKTYKIVVLNNNTEDKEEWDNPASNYIKLDASKDYILGLDISTTQSGVAVFDANMELLHMIDIINNGLTDVELYTHLRSFFTSNFKDLKFKFVVLEEQIKTSNGKMVFGQLSELQGVMLSMRDIFHTDLKQIKPTVWRKSFLADKKYEGCRKTTLAAKKSAALEVISRYDFSRYIETMKRFSKSDQGYICDSCDAVGVACGYIYEAYHATKPGNLEFINVTMKKDDLHEFSKVISLYNTKTNIVTLISKEFESGREEITLEEYRRRLSRRRGLQFKLYNDSLSLEDNIRRCTTNTNKMTAILASSPTIKNILQWESGLSAGPDDSFLVACMRTNPKRELDNHLELL